ncbi:30S ribosomal protein THX [Corallibacter sp.]
MGKGDKKTKRGKIHRGTSGARRKKIKKKPRPEEKINIDKKIKTK